jgi:hypothetical protein
MWVVPILVGGDEVLYSHRHQGAEGYLKWPGPCAGPDVVGTGLVDIDRVPADADRVVEMFGTGSALVRHGYVLLHDGRERHDPAAFPYVRVL